MNRFFKSFLRLNTKINPNVGDVPVWRGRSWQPEPLPAGGGGGGGALITAADLAAVADAANYQFPTNNPARTAIDFLVEAQGNTDTAAVVRLDVTFTFVQANYASSAGAMPFIIDVTPLLNRGLRFLGASCVQIWRDNVLVMPQDDWYSPRYSIIHPAPSVLDTNLPDVEIYFQSVLTFGKATV